MTQSVILSEAKYLKPRFFPFALLRVRMTFLAKICVNLWLNYVFLRVLVYIFLCFKKSFFSVNSVAIFIISYTFKIRIDNKIEVLKLVYELSRLLITLRAP